MSALFLMAHTVSRHHVTHPLLTFAAERIPILTEVLLGEPVDLPIRALSAGHGATNLDVFIGVVLRKNNGSNTRIGIEITRPTPPSGAVDVESAINDLLPHDSAMDGSRKGRQSLHAPEPTTTPLEAR